MSDHLVKNLHLILFNVCLINQFLNYTKTIRIGRDFQEGLHYLINYKLSFVFFKANDNFLDDVSALRVKGQMNHVIG